MSVLTAPGTEWMNQSACGPADTHLFYPDKALPQSEIVKTLRTAKAICTGCPVRTECREYADRTRESWGVWGGEARNSRAVRARRPAPERVAPCGTPAAYRAHRKRGEHPCAACIDAENTYRRGRYAEQHPRHKPRRRVAVCGTHGGLGRHYRRGEPLCRICRDFSNAYQRGLRARKRITAGTPERRAVAECGTRSGYNAHRRREETACGPCSQANTAESRDRRAQKKRKEKAS